MKKTKIICSIGPSSNDELVLTEMIANGMNVARINFSHGDTSQWLDMVSKIKKINMQNNSNIAILYDTKGPDLRIGEVENNHIKLKSGSIIRLTKKQIIGTKYEISVNHVPMINQVPVGKRILLEDGLLELLVVDKEADALVCEVIVGGPLASKKSINVPGIDLQMEFLSKRDLSDIIFACKNDGDFIALSFVNSKADVIAVRDILKTYGREDMQIIAKIESEASVLNIEEIIRVSDGIMIARGDLGVEVPLSKLPILQKDIILKCKRAGKICIVATEMLASMYQNARPSRAEISDIANAVLDGTDAVMLSGETTIGKYPVLAVKHMAEACLSAEAYYDYRQPCILKNKDIPSTIAGSVVSATNNLDIKLIIAATKSGYTARLLSHLKPRPIILATCVSKQVARSLALNYGVYAQVVGLFVDFEDVVVTAKANAMAFMDLVDNDLVIITGGTPLLNREKTTNFMKIEKI